MQVGVFTLAALLLYLALRGVDFDEVVEALRTAAYGWLVPLFLLILLSHAVRAWRWMLLLDALPPAEAAEPQRASFKNAFYALMIGYMVNYVAPRVGEVVRTANLAVQERRAFGGVLGTVVVERILDVVVLLVGLVSVFFLLLNQAETLDALFFAPVRARLEALPLLVLLAVALLGLVFVGWLVRSALRRENSRLRRLWEQRLRPVLASFRDGLATLQRSRQRGALLASTLALWACYWLMAYLPFVMLRMTEPYALSLVDAWSVMILGALGIAIPSPGGVGSYHYLTIEALVGLFGVAAAPAATYALLGHGAPMLLFIVGGVLCLILQGTDLAAVRAQARSQAPADPPASDDR